MSKSQNIYYVHFYLSSSIPPLHIYINLNRYRCEYMKQMKLCLTIVIDPYTSILSAQSTNLSRTGYIYKCIGDSTEMKCYMECVTSATPRTRQNRTDNCVWRIWIWRRASEISSIIDVGSACAAECGTRASTAVTIYCICSEALLTIMYNVKSIYYQCLCMYICM